MKKWFTIIYIISIGSICQSQDASFSQFFVIPELINPALTGTQQCDGYAAVQYRNQNQIIENSGALNTFAALAEYRITSQKNENMLGLGFVLTNDLAGQANYRVSQAMLTMAGHLRIDDNKFFSLGFLGGITQREIDFNNMIFDRQFNGTFYDPSIANGENFGREQMLHLETGVGGVFSMVGENSFKMGVAAYHFPEPNISFTEDAVIRLPIKWTGYISGDYAIGKSIKTANYIVYHAIALFQQPYNEINLGGGYRLNYDKWRFYVGGLLKFNDYRNSHSLLDALVLIGSIEQNGWRFGFNVDFSVNELIPANRTYSAIEFSFAKNLFDCQSEFVLCPKF
jgi:type IX secretion system PorP/SprF family membrane protein